MQCIKCHIDHRNVAVMADNTEIQGPMSKCPFIQETMCSESAREEAMDLAFTAQVVLQGITPVYYILGLC